MSYWIPLNNEYIWINEALLSLASWWGCWYESKDKSCKRVLHLYCPISWRRFWSRFCRSCKVEGWKEGWDGDANIGTVFQLNVNSAQLPELSVSWSLIGFDIEKFLAHKSSNRRIVHIMRVSYCIRQYISSSPFYEAIRPPEFYRTQRNTDVG